MCSGALPPTFAYTPCQTPLQGLSPEERAAVEAAIEAAFKRGSDDDFEQLMELTGAAGAEEGGGGAPGVNVQHAATGGGDAGSLAARRAEPGPGVLVGWHGMADGAGGRQ